MKTRLNEHDLIMNFPLQPKQLIDITVVLYRTIFSFAKQVAKEVTSQCNKMINQVYVSSPSNVL